MSYEPADTQGNIVRGYRHHNHAAYVFAEIQDRRAAAKLLRDIIIPRITTDVDFDDPADPPPTLNIAFTYRGLCKLAPAAVAFPFKPYEDFRMGMSARAVKELGDVDENHPSRWEPQLMKPDAEPDVLFILYATDESELTHGREALHRLLSPATGLKQGYCQLAQADRLEGEHFEREHFGFRDGLSQPALGVRRGPVAGEGVQERTGWRGVRLGEFLLGHRDEDGGPYRVLPVLKNGTFMVWRKLEQNVDGFQEWIESAAGEGDYAQERLKAQIVGRWQDGESLIVAPDRDPGANSARAGARPDNTFVYGADPRGLRCPLGAHVRRANPRDGLGYRTQRTRRDRIIRRGMPYDVDGKQGLIFVCFQASISRQFELIQRHWLQDGDALGLGAERDFLTGGGSRVTFTLPGDNARPPRFFERRTQFVTTRGGYYLFVPGIQALKRLVFEPRSFWGLWRTYLYPG